MKSQRRIQIRGLRVHNLQSIDLDIALGKLILVTGVSGSGKSSLAFDTLFAEGQRRYIETFSSYTRQFLERIDRPTADRLENIPPSIAIRQRTSSNNSRSTVGSLTEISDYLRLLFARVGVVHCHRCSAVIRKDNPAEMVEKLEALGAGVNFMVAFPVKMTKKVAIRDVVEVLRSEGFVRVVSKGMLFNTFESKIPRPQNGEPLWVVVDRLKTGKTTSRGLDSLETAFARGDDRCDLLISKEEVTELPKVLADRMTDIGQYWMIRFSRQLRCDRCDLEFADPDPSLFNPNNPVGACPVCKGFGDIIAMDMALVVPDRSLSLRQGAVAPWNVPAYHHELEELLELADDYDLPVDVPFSKLNKTHLKLIHDGVPERSFGGLRGFFRWLERKKYKMHIRVFLSRWRSYQRCPECQGTRLQPKSLATLVGGRNIAEVIEMSVEDGHHFFESIQLTGAAQRIGQVMLDQIRKRLRYLDEIGLGYIALQRPIRTLSGGELQRVALTKALGAGLVNTLYVLDEPSIGLHARDSDRLIRILQRLCRQGNTVVVVEHDEAIIRAADHLIDIGPGAGERGGRVVFDGELSELDSAEESPTADYLEGRYRITVPGKRRVPRNWIKLTGASGNNLCQIDVEFPLGVLCVVSGVSGSGKSTLVNDTLYAAVCEKLGKKHQQPEKHTGLTGVGRISDCVLVDQSPIGRSSRSNPVTYIKAYDHIRKAFAQTSDAKIRNYGPGHFSFNVDGGRCDDCKGQGVQVVDMQFLADVNVICPECKGLRFRQDVLSIKYRSKNIAQVLEMTIVEANEFFRGRSRILQALQPLIHVGLGYLRLGQPANTLSGGEAQRLKLASHIAATSRKGTLLILDEPTTGLHAADVGQLLDCFQSLIDLGHSLVVVEHQLDVIKSADWVIDLGPEAAHRGGRVVAVGTPEAICEAEGSTTAAFLKTTLDQSMSLSLV